MSVIGIVVITIVMLCAVVGAIASIFNDEEGLGREFLEGLRAIGYIFIPVAGIMASIPYLSKLIQLAFGPVFGMIGADPAMAATTFIAVDMGGYQLAHSLAESRESWIMAMMIGYMAGATIVFSIPVGLALLEKKDHKYMALGVLSGILSIPVGVLISSLLLLVLQPDIRSTITTSGPADATLALDLATILRNLAPLVLFVILIALGLHFVPNRMIRGFMLFGRVMDIAIKLILVGSIVEYFTNIFYGQGIFTMLFGFWGFDPIIADAKDPFRALEVAGYIGLMLSGAFPMVYLIKRYLAGPMEVLGRRVGLESAGAAGILAAVANILAMFRLIKDMRPKDKVLNIAFAVCAAFLFGDHLAFTANFQPNLILPVMLGKLGGGIFGFILAYLLSVPKALELEKQALEQEKHAMDQHIEAICALFPILKGKPVTFKRLTGGLTNINCLIRTGDEVYVLRLCAPGTSLLGIDRQRELACSEAAAAAGVGAAVHGFLPEIQALPGHSALLIGFCPGQTLESKDISADGLLPRLAKTLRRCHDHPAPANLGAFCAFQAIRDYHRLAKENQADLPADLPRAMERLAAIEAEVAGAEPRCLCHNDLLAGNFMDDGSDMRIIDWEYGGLGDRYFDLGNLAVNLQLNEAQERALLESYFGETRLQDLRRLRLMRLVSDLREAMWSFLQTRISTIESPVYYQQRGREHLDRFSKASQSLGSA